MPLPSSGDGRFLSQKPGKIKTVLLSTSRPGHNIGPVAPNKNNKKNNSKSNNLNNHANLNADISPNLQHIIDNHPTLNVNESIFNYDNVSTTQTSHEIVQSDDVIMSNTNNALDKNNLIAFSSDSINTESEPGTTITNSSHITNQRTIPGRTHTKHASAQHLKHFEENFTGTPIIIIELLDTNNTNGSWHPLKWAKLLCNNFFGINSIKPNGFRKVKVAFDSTFHANKCLESPLLSEHNLSAFIPSTLIFSHGIIKLDTSLPEEDFWEGLKCDVPVIAFKRISVNRDGTLTPTRLVELRFLSPNIPQSILIFNVILDVSPSIRSPLQCNNCLRFGHTSKFCRSKPRCSHCGDNNHSLNTCPSAQTTDPRCLFCQLPHLATDRSCKEWDFQKDLKKIMATENLSFKDAINFKKQNQVTSAFSYSHIVNKQPTISRPTIPSPTSLQTTSNTVSPAGNLHQFTKKPRYRSPIRTTKHFNVPTPNSLSLPNGSFLNYAANNTSKHESTTQLSDFTWINTLATKLSVSLLNSPHFSSQSVSSLQNLIESSILSLLAIPTLPSIS